MERLDNDTLSLIYHKTGSSHWSKLLCVSKKSSVDIKHIVRILINLLGVRIARTFSIKDCIMSESLIKFFINTSAYQDSMYSKRKNKLLKSILS